MDERRTIEAPATPAPPRRGGMAIWLQLLISLLVLCIAGAIWYALDQRTVAGLLASVGIVVPVAATAEAATPGQGAPATGQTPQTGQPQAQNGQGGQPQAGGGGTRQGGGNFPSRGGNRAAVVVTAPVGSAVINNKLTAIGEGTAAHAVSVTASSGGTLVSLAVKPGDVVAAGAVIGQLDSQSEQIALDRANLAKTSADEALARATELHASQSVSAVDLNAAQLASDQAALEARNAELELEKRQIVTPIAGTVGLIQVTPGNLVTAQTVVTTVEDSSEILINFWVPERYAGAIAVGGKVSAAAVAIPGKTFEGTVSAVDNRIDATSRTLQVQAVLPNPDGEIRAGMSFSVMLEFPGQTYAAVDALSIQWSSDGAYVWKVVDGKAKKGMVEIVQRNSAGVLVTGDVKDGDAIVTQGVLQLQDGAAVRLLDAGQGQGGQGSQQPAGDAAQPPAQGTPPAQTGQPGQGSQQPAQTTGQPGQGGGQQGTHRKGQSGQPAAQPGQQQTQQQQ